MVPLSILGSLGAALLLNQNLKATTFVRTLYFLPSLAPVVASAVLWRWLFQPAPAARPRASRCATTPSSRI
jgi:multiple sugar transport system permease protein